MGFAVAQQPFKVEIVMVNNSPAAIEPKSISLITLLTGRLKTINRI
jgi:hypothetical protein